MKLNIIGETNVQKTKFLITAKSSCKKCYGTGKVGTWKKSNDPSSENGADVKCSCLRLYKKDEDKKEVKNNDKQN